MTPVVLTPAELAASIAREWEEMQEHRALTAKALAMGAVPPDPPRSQVAKYAYVRPADPYTRITWTGD